MKEARQKFVLKWCLLFCSLSVFLAQGCSGQGFMPQDSICNETDTRVIYIINDNLKDEITSIAADEFVRRSYFKLKSPLFDQAAVAMMGRTYRGEIECHARIYEPTNSTDTDLESGMEWDSYPINCENATNFEEMESIVFGDSISEELTGRLFVFTIDLDMTYLHLDFFTKQSAIDARAYTIFTNLKRYSDRKSAEVFDFYHKMRAQLIIKNRLVFVDAREMIKSIPDMMVDICEEDDGILYYTRASKKDSTFMRLRMNETVSNVSWPVAQELCGKHGMRLLGPRTPAEADSFAEDLNNMLELGSYLKKTEASELNIYIGLQRNKRALGHRFEWDAGGKHLFYGKWAPEEPRGTAECAYWQFTRNNSTGNWTSVGWLSYECGRDMWAVSICQTRLYALRERMKIPDNDQPFNRSRLYSKGNFIELWDKGKSTILSLTEAVTTGRLQKMMRIGGDRVRVGNLLSPANQSFNMEERETMFQTFHKMFHTCRARDWNSFSGNSREGVSMVEVCDGKFQCTSRSDESSCGNLGNANCTSRQFTCQSKECVPLPFKCDLLKDCEDGSDELKCEFSECRHDQCADGTCLPKPWLTDGQRDCEDDMDDPQENIDLALKEPCVFSCERTKCITRELLEDDIQDCNGPEGPLDITLQPFGIVDCGLSNRRVSPKCVMVLDEFDEVIGCRDLRHLTDCADFSPCPEGYIKCPDSYCIPQGYLADGKEDCLRGEDEDAIETPDPSRNFVCNENTNQSVGLLALCDGKKDCKLGEDELDCGYPQMPGFLSLAGSLSVYDLSMVNSSDVLDNIDRRTRYLDLTGVHVPDFFMAYPQGHLRHLLTLNLSNTGIQTVYRHARDDPELCEDLFRIADFYAVQTVDLSHNNITDLPSCSYLQMMKALKYLNLAYNKNLVNVTKEMFTNLSTVVDLDLSYIGATLMEPDVFEKLPYLNRLTLRGLHMERFYVNIPKTVKYLNLEDIETQHLDKASFQNITESPDLKVSTFVYCCPSIIGDTISENKCHAPPDALSSCEDLLRDTSQRNSVQTLSGLAILSNIATLAYRLLWSTDVLTTPRRLFATNLCVSDLLMGVYLAIISVVDHVLRGIYAERQAWWRDSKICTFSGVIASMASITAAWTMLFLTLDQIQIVKYPNSQTRFTPRKSLMAVVLTWLFALVVATIPLIPAVNHWEVFSSNGMCLALRMSSKRDGGWYYSSVVFIFIIATLYTVTLIGQCYIFGRSRSTGNRFMRKMRLERKEAVDARLLELSMARRISRVAFVDFLFSFTIGTTIMLSWRGDSISPDVQAWMMVLILPITSAINPFLYFYPAWSKRLDKLQNKYKRHKAAASENSDSKRNTTNTSVTGQENDTDEDNEPTLPDNGHELLQLCCDDLDDLKEFIEWEREGDDPRIPDDELLNRDDLDMLEEELKLLEETLLEVMESTNQNADQMAEDGGPGNSEKANLNLEEDVAGNTGKAI